MKKSTALGISRSGGARNPHVFQYTLRLLVPSLGLAPLGLALLFAPGETVLRSAESQGQGAALFGAPRMQCELPSLADDFFTISLRSSLAGGEHGIAGRGLRASITLRAAFDTTALYT